MRRIIFPLCVAVAMCLPAQSAWITNSVTGSFQNGGYVPDNDLNGWASTIDLGSSPLTVGSGGVQVMLNISGGWNGDLYGYLQHGSGLVVLLNRVGQDETHPYGYMNGGFNNVWLVDGSGTYLNAVGSYSSTTPVTGTYRSQGDTGSTGLDQTFINNNIGGQWTLFLADRSSGDVSQVLGWSLAIDAVPEPTTWAMLLFGATFGGWRFWTWRAKRA